MNASEFTAFCKSKSACREGLVWIKGKSLAEFWSTCDRADWMLWLCGRMEGTKGWPTRQQIVLVACICAATSLPIFEKKYPQDDRPRKAIEAARAWANGKASIDDVRKARAAAADATTDATYDADADAAATYAATATTYATATTAATDAAYAADATAAADARACALKSMAKIVRENLTVPTTGRRDDPRSVIVACKNSNRDDVQDAAAGER